jgi:threonine dehydrogenase-like Zn-dependent dehydrogenase
MQGKVVYAAAPNVIELRSAETDEKALGPRQLLVKTHYSVISPGTELDCLSGRESGWFHIPAPLGYCAVAEVVATGEAVSSYAVGDIVLSATSHATYGVVEEDWTRGKVPAGIALCLAPLVHMALISITALRNSSAELGDFAVVIGQGLVGSLAAQLFLRQGCRVIAVDRLAGRLEISRQCGIEMLVDASKGDAVQAVKDLTGGAGAEIVIEATGSAPGALMGMDMAARNGEMILLGTPRGSCEADVIPLLRAVHRASPNLTMKGAHGGSLRSLPDPYVKHSLVRNARIVLALVARGELKLEPLVSKVVKSSDAPEAYKELREHPEKLMGVIFDWTS